TQSDGAPSRAKACVPSSSRNSRTRKARSNVFTCPPPDQFLSGAMMTTSPKTRISFTKANKPGESTPSSFVTKIFLVIKNSFGIDFNLGLKNRKYCLFLIHFPPKFFLCVHLQYVAQ